jgi:uncharacterized membrane protein YeaQ/YmgE (transglycosylase-associated protein family)
MEIVLTLGLLGWIAVIAGALVFGVLASSIGESRNGYEWLIGTVAAGIGAVVASEFIIGWQAFGPVFEGLAVVPALIGGLVVGGLADIATRFVTGGTSARVAV